MWFQARWQNVYFSFTLVCVFNRSGINCCNEGMLKKKQMSQKRVCFTVILKCNFSSSSESNSTHCMLLKNAKNWARGWVGGEGLRRGVEWGWGWCMYEAGVAWWVSINMYLKMITDSQTVTQGRGWERWAAHFCLEDVDFLFYKNVMVYMCARHSTLSALVLQGSGRF